MDWAKPTAKQNEKHLSLGSWCTYIRCLMVVVDAVLLRSLHWYLHNLHDAVIKWKHFPRYWSFVRGIHLSPVNSPYKGQWRRTLMFSLICGWIKGWVNNGKAGNLRHHHVSSCQSSIILAINHSQTKLNIFTYLPFAIIKLSETMLTPKKHLH